MSYQHHTQHQHQHHQRNYHRHSQDRQRPGTVQERRRDFLWRERFIQEEERLRQAMMRCQNDLSSLQGQIEVMCLELSFLN